MHIRAERSEQEIAREHVPLYHAIPRRESWKPDGGTAISYLTHRVPRPGLSGRAKQFTLTHLLKCRGRPMCRPAWRDATRDCRTNGTRKMIRTLKQKPPESRRADTWIRPYHRTRWTG